MFRSRHGVRVVMTHSIFISIVCFGGLEHKIQIVNTATKT